jgi:hypothetical protein
MMDKRKVKLEELEYWIQKVNQMADCTDDTERQKIAAEITAEMTAILDNDDGMRESLV